MRAKTPTFIAEFQLCATPADERALRIRLDAGRNIYNAALGEALRRLDLMRESKAHQAACKLPRGNKTTPEGKALKRARDDAFAAARDHYQFDKIDIVKFTTRAIIAGLKITSARRRRRLRRGGPSMLSTGTLFPGEIPMPRATPKPARRQEKAN